jgi:hypothetical protein
MGYLVTGNGAVNWRWESATGGAITGLHYLASAGQGAAPVFSPVGICETVAGKLSRSICQPQLLLVAG